jgi:hypothetical protein
MRRYNLENDQVHTIPQRNYLDIPAGIGTGHLWSYNITIAAWATASANSACLVLAHSPHNTTIPLQSFRPCFRPAEHCARVVKFSAGPPAESELSIVPCHCHVDPSPQNIRIRPKSMSDNSSYHRHLAKSHSTYSRCKSAPTSRLGDDPERISASESERLVRPHRMVSTKRANILFHFRHQNTPSY